jgi:tetratricopeptide (TPR) repeat protein
MQRQLALFAVLLSVSISAVASAQTITESRFQCLSNNPDIAIAACSTVVNSETEPRDVSAMLYIRGNAYSRKRDFVHAIRDYDQAISLRPDFAYAFAARGRVYDEIADYDQAIAEYDRAIKLDPNMGIVFNNRGNAYLHKGEFDRAIQDYNQAIKLTPYDAVAFEDRGGAYRLKQDCDRAIQDYDQSIRLNPTRSRAFNSRGFCYGLKGNQDQAIRDYGEAIRLDPNYVVAYFNRGISHMFKGEFDLAIRDYDLSIGLEPNFIRALYERGVAFRKKGDFERAIQDYNQVLMVDARSDLAYQSRGFVYELMGDLDHAIQDYGQAIKINPKGVPLRSRGICYFMLGQYTSAVSDFARAISIDSGDSVAVMWLYLALARMGKSSADFTRETHSLDLGKWPGPIVALYRGQLSTRQVVSATADQNQKCQALYFAGEYDLLHNNLAEAKALLQEAVANCPPDYHEYGAAKANKPKAAGTRSQRASSSNLPVEDDERHRDVVDGYIARNRDALNASIRKSRKEIAEGKGSSKSIDVIIDEGRRRHIRRS